MKHIETRKGLETLLKRLDQVKGNDYEYWHSVVEGCIRENLAMDETDYKNSPSWFRELWKGLK